MKSKLIALLLLVPQFLMAHPGHDDDADGGFTIHHYLTSPYHLSIGAGIITVIVLIVWTVKRRKKAGIKTKTFTENA